MFKNIIWDVDGTLIDTKESIIKSLQKLILEEKNELYMDEDLLFALGIPGRTTLEKLNFHKIDESLQKWNLFESQLSYTNKIFQGIENTLSTIKQNGIIQGIVTSRTKDEIDNEPLLANVLLTHIDFVVCANDTVKHKPNPEPLNKFIQISKIMPHESLYIGDSIYDFQCADSANVPFGLALWGAVNPKETKSVIRIDKPYDVLNLCS